MIDTILFDLDGTIYANGKPIKTAIDIIDKLRKEKIKMGFITNTDGRTVESIHKRITDMGFNILLKEIFTPVAAVKEFCANNPNETFYCLVTDSVFKSLDIKINEVNPDYIVIGDFSDKISYDEINKIFRFIMNGSSILALSKSNYYFQDNRININTGAFVSMFEKACAKEAILLGKPSKDFFNLALNKIGSVASNTLVVGDDITVDIVGAKAINALSVLVKTGHYNEALVNKSIDKPDYIIEDITKLPDLLTSLI